jgi:hypothetical protein
MTEADALAWWMGCNQEALRAELRRCMDSGLPRVELAAITCRLALIYAATALEEGRLDAWLSTLPDLPDPLPGEVERIPHGRKRADAWRTRRAAGMV